MSWEPWITILDEGDEMTRRRRRGLLENVLKVGLGVEETKKQ